MSQTDWKKLRDWLFAVFPPDLAQADFDAQVAEARALGLELPRVA